MKSTKPIGVVPCLLALCGIVLPMPYVCAATTESEAKAPGQRPLVNDVVMTTDGVLRGKVVGPLGQPIGRVPVQLEREGRTVHKTTTGADGAFFTQVGRGGLYRVLTAGGQKVVRAWTPRSAPPGAADCVVIQLSDMTVRGQLEAGTLNRWVSGSKYAFTNPFVVGGIVVAAVAIPVAIHNRNRASGS